jgi:hypothetical protein
MGITVKIDLKMLNDSKEKKEKIAVMTKNKGIIAMMV